MANGEDPSAVDRAAASGRPANDKEKLKRRVLFSVLQYFGDECDLAFDDNGVAMVEELLEKTLWGAIDGDKLVWTRRTRGYVRKWTRRIGDEVCDDLRSDGSEEINGRRLFRVADPIIREAKRKGDESLARLLRKKDAGDYHPDDGDIEFLAMLTRYCDDYPE